MYPHNRFYEGGPLEGTQVLDPKNWLNKEIAVDQNIA